MRLRRGTMPLLGVLSLSRIAAAEDAKVPLRGQVVDPTGTPIANMLVFAMDEEKGSVSAAGKSDRDGRFVVEVPPRKHKIGVVSTLYRVFAYEEWPATELKLVVTAEPLAVNAEATRSVLQGPSVSFSALPRTAVVARTETSPDAPAQVTSTAIAVGIVRGRIVDETGVPLAGVRVVAIDTAKNLLAVTSTDAQGRYVLAIRDGSYRIGAISLGLKVGKTTRKGDHEVDFVMAVDAAPQVVTITEGHVLSFRINDSIWPEYFPPPQVRAWLHFAYGIAPSYYHTCPSLAHTMDGGGARSVHCPPSAWVYSRKPSKFWWLQLLQRPPNTARVGSYQRPPPPPAFNAPPGVPD